MICDHCKLKHSCDEYEKAQRTFTEVKVCENLQDWFSPEQHIKIINTLKCLVENKTAVALEVKPLPSDHLHDLDNCKNWLDEMFELAKEEYMK